MKRTQINLLNSMKSIVQFFTENPNLLNDKPSLKVAVDKLKVMIGEMEALQKTQGTSAKADVALKSETRTTLEQANAKVLAGVKAVGAATNDTRLKMASDLTDYDLGRMRDNALINQSHTTYELALPLIAQLAEWDVTADDVEAVNTNSTAYDAKDPAIKNIKARSTQATDELKNKSKEATAFIKDTLDDMMLPLKASNPSLHGQYIKARTIINTAGGHSKGTTPDTSTTGK